MSIKLIIFDFDGTLGDTRRNIVTTMQMTIKEMQLWKELQEAGADFIIDIMEELIEIADKLSEWKGHGDMNAGGCFWVAQRRRKQISERFLVGEARNWIIFSTFAARQGLYGDIRVKDIVKHVLYINTSNADMM